jgi:hypothetical protein
MALSAKPSFTATGRSSCSLVQRFGGSLNLNVHFHTLLPDGVFDLSQNPVRFLPVPRPKAEDLEGFLLRVIRRVEQVVAFSDDADPEPLATLQADSVEQRRSFSEPFRPSGKSVFLEGFSLHAGTRVHENDREGLERLCRYAARPPLALDRLSRSSDGRLVYRMKRARDGVLDLVLTPEELMKKLATLVPPPRAHGVRYHGVYAPNSNARRRVVPAESEPAHAPVTESPPQAEPLEFRKTQRIPWAELLKRVFSLDVLACPQCKGRMTVIVFISQATALGLGFQLFSTVQIMTDSRELMGLLGLEPGVWELDACAFGYPAQEPEKRDLPPLYEMVRWLE